MCIIRTNFHAVIFQIPNKVIGDDASAYGDLSSVWVKFHRVEGAHIDQDAVLEVPHRGRDTVVPCARREWEPFRLGISHHLRNVVFACRADGHDVSLSPLPKYSLRHLCFKGNR